MSWRLAQSLVVLRDQIDAMYPNRDKRTDGALSGYPGSISGHNPNSQGVVCALDITTGDYPGGISMAQSYALADAIRLELLVAPRGLYTYLIHHMEPPYVPTPGKYIAHGGPASLWQWIPYTGADAHTSHIHVSVDWDIAAGEDASGQDPYDMTDAWNLSAVSAQSGSINPITKEWYEMALDDQAKADIKALLLEVAKEGDFGRSIGYYTWVETPLPGFNGNVSAAARVAGIDAALNGPGGSIVARLDNLPTTFLKQTLKLTDGSVATVASVLASIQSKPAGGKATVDVEALATDLAPLLATNQVEQFVTAIRNLKFAAQ